MEKRTKRSQEKARMFHRRYSYFIKDKIFYTVRHRSSWWGQNWFYIKEPRRIITFFDPAYRVTMFFMRLLFTPEP